MDKQIEKLKKVKKIMLYLTIFLATMFFAYLILTWVMSLFANPPFFSLIIIILLLLVLFISFLQLFNFELHEKILELKIEIEKLKNER